MRKTNDDTLSKEFMGWKLGITVRKSFWTYEVRVTYKGEPYILPDSIEILFDCLLDQLDGKHDVAVTVYEKIEKEVNEALCEYQMNEAAQNVVQFRFPTPPQVIGYWCFWDIDTAISSAQAHADAIRNITNSISAGAPTITMSDRYDSGMVYLTSEEYEEKRERGELHSWRLYVVLN